MDKLYVAPLTQEYLDSLWAAPHTGTEDNLLLEINRLKEELERANDQIRHLDNVCLYEQEPPND